MLFSASMKVFSSKSAVEHDMGNLISRDKVHFHFVFFFFVLVP